VLCSYVSIEAHPRRSPRLQNVLTCQPSNLLTGFPPNSFPVNYFADPHHLSPLESYSFKKGGGGGAVLRIGRTAIPVRQPDLSPLFATLMKTPGVRGHSSQFGKPARSRRQELTFLFKFFLFTLFQTLLHSRKTQLVSFQAIPNSFTKTPGGGGTFRLPTCNHSNSQAMLSAPVDRWAKAGDNFMSTSSTGVAAKSEEGE
jgi:hypothetical protein